MGGGVTGKRLSRVKSSQLQYAIKMGLSSSSMLCRCAKKYLTPLHNSSFKLNPNHDEGTLETQRNLKKYPPTYDKERSGVHGLLMEVGHQGYWQHLHINYATTIPMTARTNNVSWLLLHFYKFRNNNKESSLYHVYTVNKHTGSPCPKKSHSGLFIQVSCRERSSPPTRNFMKLSISRGKLPSMNGLLCKYGSRNNSKDALVALKHMKERKHKPSTVCNAGDAGWNFSASSNHSLPPHVSLLHLAQCCQHFLRGGTWDQFALEQQCCTKWQINVHINRLHWNKYVPARTLRFSGARDVSIRALSGVQILHSLTCQASAAGGCWMSPALQLAPELHEARGKKKKERKKERAKETTGIT
ncbi:hypothetical protein C0J52_06921 [Blattella germanica]|nr:hypothetical protein C0J52_06921 [Blattella germanica]